jgi:hypothetical protein
MKKAIVEKLYKGLYWLQNFIKDIFSTYANEFKFEKRLENLSTFPAINDEKALKNLIFITVSMTVMNIRY